MSLYIPLLLISSLARFESDAQVKAIRQRVQKADAYAAKRSPERFMEAQEGTLATYEKYVLVNDGHKLVYNAKSLDGGSAIKWYYLDEAGKPYFIYQYSSSPLWAEDGEGPNLKRHQELRCYFHGDSLLYAWTKEKKSDYYAKPELSKVPLVEAEACQDLQTLETLESYPVYLQIFPSSSEGDAYSLEEAAHADEELAKLLKQIQGHEYVMDEWRREDLTEEGDGGSENKYAFYWQGEILRAVELEGSYEDSEWNSTWYFDAEGGLFYSAQTQTSRYVCGLARETCATGWEGAKETHLFFQDGKIEFGLSRSYESIPLREDGGSILPNFPFAYMGLNELSTEERDANAMLLSFKETIAQARNGNAEEEE